MFLFCEICGRDMTNDEDVYAANGAYRCEGCADGVEFEPEDERTDDE